MPQDLFAKKSNFVSRFVGHIDSLVGDINALLADRLEYDTTGYGPGSGSPYEITEEDLLGSNSHVSPQEIADAFSSLEAMKGLLIQGHLTNLNKLRT